MDGTNINDNENWLRLQEILTFEDYLSVDQNVIMGDVPDDHEILRSSTQP